MRRVRLLEWVLIVSILFVGYAILFPTFAYDGIRAPDASCLSNVKQSSLAMIVYASDENDRFAPRDRWMDASYPYTKNEGFWHCPSVLKGVYGYAFNGALDQAKAPKEAAGTPLPYDSVNPIRNASDLVASLPSPGRHNGNDSVGYADGLAKRVPVVVSQ